MRVSCIEKLLRFSGETQWLRWKEHQEHLTRFWRCKQHQGAEIPVEMLKSIQAFHGSIIFHQLHRNGLPIDSALQNQLLRTARRRATSSHHQGGDQLLIRLRLISWPTSPEYPWIDSTQSSSLEGGGSNISLYLTYK